MFWEREQLAPFEGGRRCSRLVTTRAPGLLAGRGTAIPVDQMSAEQARRLLTYGLPPLDPAVAGTLLSVTGRWPLLLRLANKILAHAVNAGRDVSAAGATLSGQLRVAGPAAADNLLSVTGLDVTGLDVTGLDVAQPGQRAQAVRATIEASTSLLSKQDTQRFDELGVFAEGEVVSFELVALLWHETAGLVDVEASKVCHRLASLGLITLTTLPTADGGGSGLVLHDVIRDFLRGELAANRLAELHEALLDAAAATLSPPDPLGPGDTGLASMPWWELSDAHGYMSDHLIEHLIASGRADDADTIACDLRWAGARLTRSGPAAPIADLSLVGTPCATRLSATLVQAAHLLARTDPSEAVVDVLHSRVASDPDWGAQVTALRNLCRRPQLVNRWPMPDVPDSAFRLALTGHDRRLYEVAIAPDGTWLATGGDGGTVQIWDTTSWAQKALFAGHRSGVSALAIAPDGTWLATGRFDGAVQIWDTTSWAQKAVLTGHRSTVFALAIAPDGTWLATGDHGGGAVQIWDTTNWVQRIALSGRRGYADEMVVSPDGTWLATQRKETIRIWDTASWAPKAALGGSRDDSDTMAVSPDGAWLATGGLDWIRIWDTASWTRRAAFRVNGGDVIAMAIAPDGTWLATGSRDGTVQIWDVARQEPEAVLTGHRDRADVVAIAPDGTWLASGSGDGTVRIWDTTRRAQKATAAVADRKVFAVAAAPDGTWLATGGHWTVGIWDTANGVRKAALDSRSGVSAIAIAPDGTWLATGGFDGTVQIWDTTSRAQRAVFTGHRDWVSALAIALDGTWLATGSYDGTVRIWDATSMARKAAFRHDRYAVDSVAIAPDGTWLASGGVVGTVRIWDTARWARRAARVLKTDYDHGQMVAIAPDGTWLASAGGDQGTVRIWDTTSWAKTATLTGHDREVKAVAIAPNGTLLATTDLGGSVRIWEVTTGRVQAMMRVDDAISACAWISSGRLALGGAVGWYVFDLVTGTESASPIRLQHRSPKPSPM